MRRVIFEPYRKGPSFTLTMWEAVGGVRYRLTQREGHKRRVLFEGSDVECSAPHSAIDSDEAVRVLMNFLTLRPGDTDWEYFENYTDSQREFCDQRAEDLACEVMRRFGEGRGQR